MRWQEYEGAIEIVESDIYNEGVSCGAGNPEESVFMISISYRTAWSIVIVALVANVATGQIQPAEDAPRPLSPAQSAAKMQLPAGFRIDVVASEPLVADPTCVAFDEFGRFFVCELHGYNLEGHLDVTELNKTGVLDTKVRRIRWERVGGKLAEEARENQFGTVKLLEDTDSDGRMDKAHVWADRIPTCYGIVAARGGLIVVCAPDILYLADRDGDGKAEIRETLYTGFRLELLERGTNNPRWGPDNWIYVGAGGGGGTITGSRLKKPVQIGDTDYRIKADGSAIEPVHGRVRTFGLAMDRFGNRFPAHAQPALYALPLPHRYLKRNPHVASPRGNQHAASFARGYPVSSPHPWRVKRGEDPAWIKFYGREETDSGYFTGGCGNEIYMADLFPPMYRGNLFVCEPSLNIINRSILRRDGAGFLAHRAKGEQNSEFVASADQWFRPINIRVGPDGGMLIVDMYREIIEDYSAIPRFLQQQYGIIKGSDMGRIWRLVPESAPALKPVRLADFTTDQLVRATGDTNAWHRYTAQRMLIERGDRSAAPGLAQQVRRDHGNSAEARLHALYTLDGLGELEPAVVAHALDDPGYGVRMHALQLAERWLDANERLLTQVLSMTDDPDPRVRLQLAMSLGESADRRAVDALLTLTRERGDERWMSSAILSSVRETAGELLTALLSEDEITPGARSVLAPLAATVAARRDRERVSDVVNAVVHHGEDVQVECLQGLVSGLPRGADLTSESSDDWVGAIELVGSDSPRVRKLAIQLGVHLNLQSPEIQAALEEAVRQALDEDATADQRQEAIALLAYAPYNVVAPVTAKLLDVRQPPALQTAAVQALAASQDPRVGAALLQEWKGFTPQVRKAALDAVFNRQDRLPALLDAIEDHMIRPEDLNDVQRRQLLKTQNAEIAARAGVLLDRPGADADLQRRIDRYQQALAQQRDTSLGKQVYAKNCMICHKIKDEGHEVGPALGSVINKPDEAILLDILDPSGHIESEYTSYVVVTEDGKILTGILASDSATSVTLLREKGEADTILRTEIESMTASDLSLMPSDVHKAISPQDAANVIAYLREVFGTVPLEDR